MRLTRANLLSWLQSKEPDEIVGRRRSRCECPLAVFLRDAGASDPYVELESYTRDHRRGINFRTPLPLWAQKIVERVDGHPTVKSLVEGVTAREMLQHMEVAA